MDITEIYLHYFALKADIAQGSAIFTDCLKFIVSIQQAGQFSLLFLLFIFQ